MQVQSYLLNRINPCRLTMPVSMYQSVLFAYKTCKSLQQRTASLHQVSHVCIFHSLQQMGHTCEALQYLQIRSQQCYHIPLHHA